MNAKYKTSLILIIAAAAFMNSCKQPTEVNAEPDVIIPLKIGNLWVEKITIYDSLGNTMSTMIDTQKVINDTVIGNEKWYSYGTKYILFTNKPDGYYMRYINAYDTSYSITILWKYPAMVNESYNVQTGNFVVKSLNDNVTVPAGNFNCLQYRFFYGSQPVRPNTGYEQDWFSPGLGPVRTLGNYVTQSGKDYVYYSAELISYKLN